MIYYIEINYMFRHFSLAIFRLINEKLNNQLIKARDARRIKSNRDEIYEKNSRIHLDRLQNKFTHCKGI